MSSSRDTTQTILKILKWEKGWLEHSVCNQGVVGSSPIIGILTENFSTGTRSSCVQ